MERIFLDIINMSLTGSIAILCVLLARQLLRRAPKLSIVPQKFSTYT